MPTDNVDTGFVDFYNVKVGDRWKWVDPADSHVNWMIEEVISVDKEDQLMTKIIASQSGLYHKYALYQIRTSSFDEVEVWFMEPDASFDPNQIHHYFNDHYLELLCTGNEEFIKINNDTELLLELL